MFTQLLKFEIKDRLARWSSLVYFIVYFAISFLLSVSFAGAFKGVSVNFGLSNKLALNSPVVLQSLTSLMSYLGLLVTAPLFGQSIFKDFENKFSQILFATPLKKRTYFVVRYFGSALSMIVILLSIACGIWFATLMPFVDRSLIGPNRLSYYAVPYLTTVVPNILIFGAIFLAVVSYFKKMAPVYVASIAVFTGWMIAQNLTADIDNKWIAAMIEPFGFEAASLLTRYWSIVEQSTRVVPLNGVFLQNRLIWSAVGLVFFVFAYIVFDPFRLPREKAAKNQEPNVPTGTLAKRANLELPHAILNIDSLRVFWGLAKSEFRQAFSNLYFLMILLCGVLYIFAISGQIGKIFGTETLPVTYHVLEVVGGTFGLFVVILTTFYAGELVWKDRDQAFSELVDSKPISNLYLYLSKLCSLWLVQIFLTVVIFVSCVLIQLFKGYTNFEWRVYFDHLVVYTLPSRFLVCVLALFVQAVSRNKYIGHSIIILYWICLIWLPNLGLDHHLYLIGQLPHAAYSDMNGFGTSFYPYSVFALYWGFFHLGLAVLTLLLWPRGRDDANFKLAMTEMKRRMTTRHKGLLVFSLAGWVLLGGFIYYNTNVLNLYETKSEKELKQVDYEKTYKEFSIKPQPQVVAVDLHVDIFPAERALQTKSVFKYRNKSDQPIIDFMVNIFRELKIDSLEWSRPTKLKLSDPRLEVQVFEFDPPLMPNEEVTLHFNASRAPQGFENGEFQKHLIQNGSFLQAGDFAPTVGYVNGGEIIEEKTRRKYQLPERPRMRDVNDTAGLAHTYISNEGTWIDFEATVSTSADQTAIAPGYLEKEWREGDRHYFHYKMDRPVLNFYSILSARYEVVRDHWNNVAIEVFHHPGHTVDIPRMIKSVKKSLDYFTTNFSPYQFRQFRILEFPRYARFAQAFPNTIPFSESIGFIARVRENDPESIDYPFYVTAHELAHQWWAHQVVGADVQGSTMLSESLAQYSSLMVQEKEYGPKQMKKFLRYELDRYLMGRAGETKRELPLDLNENQQYIHYEKGSLVFYALKDLIGEDVLNGVLREFIHDHAFKDAPFPRAVDLVAKLRAAVSPAKRDAIEDLFGTITFYDNRTDSVTVEPETGGFKTTVKTQSKKSRVDLLGVETPVALDDEIDIGLFDDSGVIMKIEKRRVVKGENSFEFHTSKAPGKAGIDPLNKLIDRVPEDNVVKAVSKP